jgi:hypothetical protein
MIGIGTKLINGKIVALTPNGVVIRRPSGAKLVLPFSVIEAQIKAMKCSK